MIHGHDLDAEIWTLCMCVYVLVCTCAHVCFRTRAPAWNLSSTLMHSMWAPRALTPATHHPHPQEVPTNPRAQPCRSPPVSVILPERWGAVYRVPRGLHPQEKQGGPATKQRLPSGTNSLPPCLPASHPRWLPDSHLPTLWFLHGYMKVTQTGDRQTWWWCDQAGG